jgi:hypothetical protein
MTTVEKINAILANAEKDLDIPPPLKLVERRDVRDIPRRLPLVYILLYGDKPLVVGEGKYERARVIFDRGPTHVTWHHIKSFLVRLYTLYGTERFTQYTITCQSKGDAQKVEDALHAEVGGNENKIPAEFMDRLCRGLPVELGKLLEAASLSAYSGLRDLRVWRDHGIIDACGWVVLCDRLRLPLDPIPVTELHPA